MDQKYTLWEQAYKALKDSRSKLVDDYERRLTATLHNETAIGFEEGSYIATKQAMERVITFSLKHMESIQLGADNRGHTFAFQYTKIYTAYAVSWMRSQIEFAATRPMYSPILMASVAFVLPLLETPAAVDEARSSGIAYAISQIYYYAAMETLLKQSRGSFDLKEKGELATELSRIYQSVLELQIRRAIHMHVGRANGFPRDSAGQWETQLEGIREAELKLESRFFEAQLVSADVFELLRGLRYKAELSRMKLDDMLQDLSQARQEVLAIEEKQKQRTERTMHRACIEALNAGSHPEDDASRIAYKKGGLCGDACSWIFGSESFQRWRKQGDALLWIKGDRDKGKTMLACAIIDKLTKYNDESNDESNDDSEARSSLCYFFCEESNDQNNSATAVLRGLIYMLVNQQPWLKEHLRQLIGGCKDADAWIVVSQVFTDMVKDTRLRSTCFLIDGLDECIVGLDNLLSLITRLLATQRVKWILFRRNDSKNVSSNVQVLEMAKESIVLSLENNKESISSAVSLYIKHKFTKLEATAYKDYSKHAEHARARRVVAELLAKTSNGTFYPVADICAELEHMQQWQVLYGIANGKWPSWSNKIDSSLLDYLLQG